MTTAKCVTELTENQKKTLISAMRSRWAMYLLKERKAFRQDIKELNDFHHRESTMFIKKEKISCDVIHHGIDLAELNAFVHELSKNLLRTDTSPEIELDYSNEYDCYDNVEERTIEPFARVYHYRYSFNSLALCKKYIRGCINNTVSEAVFKFKRQYNGKDVKAFLLIIKKEEKRLAALPK